MNIDISASQRGDVRTMNVLLSGGDSDFINLIDEGEGTIGTLAILVAKIANAQPDLVALRSDPASDAARLLRRAAELLERTDEVTRTDVAAPERGREGGDVDA